MKLGVVILLGFGVIALAPTVQMPRMTTFVDGGGPIIPGTVFPFLFITIACGAVSGFHALVSSGTTPKMIEQESQALVGYAAMLLESFVGVMALVAATVLLPGDYFSINTCCFPCGRNGLDLFGVARNGGANGLLVPVCASVRGVVHFDHHRYWDPRCTVPDSGNGRARISIVPPIELAARSVAQQRRRRRGLGFPDCDGQHFHNLADVRRS
jgi:carbon starvation protein CstA